VHDSYREDRILKNDIKTVRPVLIRSIDYPFLVTIGGIGGLVSLAGLLLGTALGVMPLGYFLAAVTMAMTGLIIGKCVYQGCETSPSGSASLPVTRHPFAITSVEGELVYCNMPYRRFVRDVLKRKILSPLDLMDGDEQQALAAIISSLEGDEVRVIPFISREDTKKYIKATLSRKEGQEDFINWIFSGLTSADSLEKTDSPAGGFNLAQLGSILDISDCGLVEITEQGQIIYANDMLLHWIAGPSAQDIELPQPLSDFCAISPRQLSGQVKIQTLSGDDMMLEFLPVEMTSGNSETIICQVLCRDSRVSSNIPSDFSGGENINFDRFFRESPIGIAIVTAQGEILEKNHIFRNYIQELDIRDSRSLNFIIDPDEYQEFYDGITATLTTGQAVMVADVGFKGRGERYGQIYITRLNKFADHDDVVILYLIDTTEQKNLELQFAQSQKMQAVGQLAGGVAHDFNNLLTAIIGFSDLLLVRHGPGDQSFSDIIQIKQNANRAANLVRQLLAFSRQQTLRPKVLVITDVLAELSNLLGRLIGDNIELHMTHGRNLGQIKVDQGQLEQVIINLCVNARDAMEQQGKISIRTRNISLQESRKLGKRYQVMPPNEYVLLEVEDSGCGIAKEHLGKIFEPFFSTKEVGKGTGLGLSTVYGIVKQTGGFVFPASEVGEGTIFSIYLPVYKEVRKDIAETEKAVSQKPTRDLTGKGTILLVEDEDAVCMFASRALRNKGYNVYEANSGEAALELFGKIEDELDLLISDVVMPIMDGPTLVRKIRETNSKLKVIFISGYAEDAFDKTQVEDDFHFLPKPFSLKQLAEQVKEVLERD